MKKNKIYFQDIYYYISIYIYIYVSMSFAIYDNLFERALDTLHIEVIM